MQKLKDINLTVYPYIKNKFIFTSLLFLVWMTFFDQNNFISQIQDRIKLGELENHRDQLSAEIKESTEDIRFMRNEELLEKFARERYLMKKENEDIFVFAVEEE